MKHSDYSLIPTFVSVMQEQNYTRAAKKLGISQSAVSQNVARLRDVFNDNLFIRGSHGVTATPFAHDIYPTLASAVESIEYTLPEHKNFRPHECTKQFSIAALSAFGYTLLPDLALTMSQSAPKARVKIDPFVGQDIGSLLRAQQCDLVLEAKSNRYPQLRSERILKDRMVVLCRSDHPRLKGQTINSDQFLAEKHVVHTTNQQNKGYLIGYGLKAESTLSQRDVVWQSGSIMEAVPVVAKSDYITLVPQRLIANVLNEPSIKILDVEFIDEFIDVVMYWHPSRTHDPSHKWLRSTLLKVAQHI
jgi:DNA-binding transcriptional LysR family regulator